MSWLICRWCFVEFAAIHKIHAQKIQGRVFSEVAEAPQAAATQTHRAWGALKSLKMTKSTRYSKNPGACFFWGRRSAAGSSDTDAQGWETLKPANNYMFINLSKFQNWTIKMLKYAQERFPYVQESKYRTRFWKLVYSYILIWWG